MSLIVYVQVEIKHSGCVRCRVQVAISYFARMVFGAVDAFFGQDDEGAAENNSARLAPSASPAGSIKPVSASLTSSCLPRLSPSLTAST